MAFVSDSFIDTDAVDLENHTGETGATWTEHPSLTAGAHRIATNRLRCATSPSGHYASGVPASADYDVEGVFFVHTVAGNSVGMAGRMSTSADDCYLVRYATGTGAWELVRDVGGTLTILGSWAETLSAGNSRTVKLEIRGTALKVYVDGVERISVTDNTHSAAGRVGVRSDGTQAATARYHLDSITGTDVAGGTGHTEEPADSIAGTDASARHITKAIAESLAVTDTGFEKTVNYALDDSATVSDAINTGGASNLTRQIDDAVVGTDTVGQAVGIARSDTIQGVDAAVKGWSGLRADVITVTDEMAADLGLVDPDTAIRVRVREYPAHIVHREP
jgi:hypothetical protein